MKFLATLFSLFDKLLAYINTQQLKKAGKDELKTEINEAENVLRKKNKATIKANSALSDDDIIAGLRKYERK
jgi:hypothetical protein